MDEKRHFFRQYNRNIIHLKFLWRQRKLKGEGSPFLIHCTFWRKYPKFLKGEGSPFFNPLHFRESAKRILKRRGFAFSTVTHFPLCRQVKVPKVNGTLGKRGNLAFFCFAAKGKLSKEKGLHFSGFTDSANFKWQTIWSSQKQKLARIVLFNAQFAIRNAQWMSLLRKQI